MSTLLRCSFITSSSPLPSVLNHVITINRHNHEKPLIAISVSILLFACGGDSNGGSKKPILPPKPPVAEETIQSIANDFNVD